MSFSCQMSNRLLRNLNDYLTDWRRGKTTTLTEIELKLGVSREQVREIERKVLSYIKEHY